MLEYADFSMTDLKKVIILKNLHVLWVKFACFSEGLKIKWLKEHSLWAFVPMLLFILMLSNIQ